MRQPLNSSVPILAAALAMSTVICHPNAALAQEPKNLAYDKPAPAIPARLTERSKKMEQRVYKVASNVYSAVGYAIANSIMIEGRDGIIIVDTTESVESGKAALAEFRKITAKPCLPGNGI